eukprot:12901045-Prorocentrum_lima.AAC.1
MIGFSDTSWGTRPDASSQGGFVVGLTHRDELGVSVSLFVLLDWSSKSLNREAQGAAACVDSMKWLKT